ncbi:MAG: response regulator [Sphaerochaeta sp.]|nr:response regulator [Sphaerochaeta sp.]
MVSLLIVDDEPIEREAIRLLVLNNLSDIVIVGEAGNGIEALRIARLKKPDIIMIDINMPGMNGLECIEHITKEQINTKFIVVTSYSTFAFAQQAIRLGVYDFLVKPAEIDVIRKTFTKVTNDIYLERMNSSMNKQLEERVDALNPVVELNILKSLLNKDSDADFPHLFSLLSLSPHRCCVFLVRRPEEKRIEFQRLALRLKQLGFISLTCPKDASTEVAVIVREHNKKDSHDLSLAEYISDHIVSMGVGWHGGIGDWVSDVRDLPKSYDQACTSLKHAIRNNLEVCSIGDVTVGGTFDSYKISHYVKELTRLIIQQAREPLLEAFDEFFEMMKLNDQEMLGENTFHMLLLIKQKLSETITGYSIRNEEFSHANSITSQSGEHMIRQWMHGELLDLLQEVDLARDSQKGSLYQFALDYIQKNFQQSIELDDLAARLGISASYVSKLLRKNAGKSFSEIVTELRLEKSKLLLADVSLSVKEITFSVGFNSQHYFARLFKKYVGCSPSDYRRLLH